jgi:predicted DCC family thiol-disulfide oxidoreductase YuxK
MATELIPLKPEQHKITFVPKTTTDLPFFNLTYRKKEIPKAIKYEGVDEAGHPIRWEVYHNTNSEIGHPGVEAHEVWYLLIKPAIDATRKIDGSISQIIQLGGMRECLRMVGWTAGGNQARELIKSLTQIAFSGCVADLWFPTGETDDEGKQKYLQIKSRFSRLSVYAIGEHHLSEDDLKNAEFAFDLEDKLYIRLDPIEVRLQQLQAGQQRLIDNAYMFSIKPIARRWYELLAGKIFGTIKHNAPYFEIRYSWYIKHHHTLKKFHQRFRIVEQMNRVVQDHLDSGFITRVEYRKIKEPDREEDFTIRYFVGAGAKQSINRIQGHILNRRKREATDQVSVKEALITENTENAILSDLNSGDDTELPLREKVSVEAANLNADEKPKDGADIVLAITTLETHLTGNQRELFTRLIADFSITETKAYELVKKYPVEKINSQVEAFQYRGETVTSNKAGFLIRAIEENYSFPERYLDELKGREAEEKQMLRQKQIDDCSYCDERGFRNVKSDRDIYFGLMHQCTHDSGIENQLEDQN